MSKLFLSNRVPREYDSQTFADLFRAIEQQVNSLSEGRLNAKYNANSVPPSGSVANALGDVVFNTNPTSSGYIGWVCIAAGSPGTWTTFGAIS